MWIRIKPHFPGQFYLKVGLMRFTNQQLGGPMGRDAADFWTVSACWLHLVVWMSCSIATMVRLFRESSYTVIYIYIWLCLFLTRAVFSKGRKFDLCESYPRIIPRNHTPKNHDYECFFFGIVWDCIGLTRYNGPDKLIDQCWPDPMIPGYLHRGNISLSVAELKVHEKNIQKRRRQAGGYKS